MKRKPSLDGRCAFWKAIFLCKKNLRGLGLKLKRIENKIDKPFSKGYTGDVEKFT